MVKLHFSDRFFEILLVLDILDQFIAELRQLNFKFEIAVDCIRLFIVGRNM